MQWALIATVEQEIWVINPQTNNWEQIMGEPGTIVNLIVYDGITPFTPPDGMKLDQVPDSAQIGDTGY